MPVIALPEKKKENKSEKEEVKIECLVRDIFLSRKPKKIIIIIKYE